MLRVPAGAVASGSVVLVLAGGRLHERPVSIGMRSWQQLEVTSGLAAGELVVTGRDSPTIRAGARARTREPR